MAVLNWPERRILVMVGVAQTVLFVLMSSPLLGAVDHGLYGELLQRYVHHGVVDYQGFQDEELRLDAYLDQLAAVDPDQLAPPEQYAFYINAYNAWTIKLILSGYPGIKSIKELGSVLKSPWKKKLARINGELLTLDQIEHDILRPRFKDPRVHFAVNCASKSCPPLASVPYTGADLEQQLDDATRAFINDTQHNYLHSRELHVSSIFKWFKKDFDKDIPGFFMKYAAPDFKIRLKDKQGKLKVKYLEYDWTLNGK